MVLGPNFVIFDLQKMENFWDTLCRSHPLRSKNAGPAMSTTPAAFASPTGWRCYSTVTGWSSYSKKLPFFFTPSPTGWRSQQRLYAGGRTSPLFPCMHSQKSASNPLLMYATKRRYVFCTYALTAAVHFLTRNFGSIFTIFVLKFFDFLSIVRNFVTGNACECGMQVVMQKKG